MKSIFFAAILIIGSIAFYAFNHPHVNFSNDPAEGIQFHRGNWTEALEKAKKENKLIFLDIYATWCGPCKRLKAKTFSDKIAAKFFNEHFINVSLDGETGEGAILAGKYNLTGYPSLFIIDAGGKLVTQTMGYQSPEELIGFGKSIFKQ